MKDQKTIAWQKYEDYIEKQLSSPVLTNIMQNIATLHTHFLDDEDDAEDEDEDDEAEDEDFRAALDVYILCRMAYLLHQNN